MRSSVRFIRMYKYMRCGALCHFYDVQNPGLNLHVRYLFRFISFSAGCRCRCYYCRKNCNYLFTICSVYWQRERINHNDVYTPVCVERWNPHGTDKNSSRKFIRYVAHVLTNYCNFYIDGRWTARPATDFSVSAHWIAIANMYVHVNAHYVVHMLGTTHTDLWNGCAHARIYIQRLRMNEATSARSQFSFNLFANYIYFIRHTTHTRMKWKQINGNANIFCLQWIL